MTVIRTVFTAPTDQIEPTGLPRKSLVSAVVYGDTGSDAPISAPPCVKLKPVAVPNVAGVSPTGMDELISGLPASAKPFEPVSYAVAVRQVDRVE